MFLDRLLILKKVDRSLLLCQLTYLMQCDQGVNHFVQLADDSDEVLILKGKQYSDFRLQKQDWAMMVLMHEVLQVCTHLALYLT
jgi:hypothetical protein